MKKYFVLLSLVFALTSCGCFEFTAPEMRGGEKFEITKVDGSTIQMNVKADMYNENCFGVKIKPSTLDLYVEGEQIGTVRLNKKVKLKSKQESSIDADITATLTGGALMKLMAYAAKPEVVVELKGKAKAGIFIFSKKIEINEKKTVSGSNFKMGF